MKDKNLHKGIEELKKINLSLKDKQNMLGHISLYIDEHPVPEKTERSVKSPFAGWGNLFYKKVHFAYGAMALFVIITMGFGTAVASEKALPGDLLYPIKIKIAEPVKGAFKVTPEAKVKWESEKALKRLEEAEKLAEQGQLNNEKRIKIEGEFEKNKNAFIERVDRKKDFAEIEKETQKKEKREDEKSLQQTQENSDKEIESEKEDVDEREKKFEMDVQERLEKINKKKQDSQDDQNNEINNLEKNIKEKVNSLKERKSKN